MITNVTIERVKGIGYKSFDLEIKENKYNLLVAPNGFGKSSFFLKFMAKVVEINRRDPMWVRDAKAEKRTACLYLPRLKKTKA